MERSPGQEAIVVKQGHEFEGQKVVIELTDCEDGEIFAWQYDANGTERHGRKYAPEDLKPKKE